MVAESHRGLPQRSAAEHALQHAASYPITLGLEEELQPVGDDGDLVAHDFARGLRERPGGPGSTSCEIHRCALEVQTPVCNGVDELIASLAAMRQMAAARAAEQGQRVLAAGLHPFARWAEQPLHDDPVQHPHYAHLLREYGDVARGAMSFALHVHLGLARPEWRMPVMNRLRHVLPELMALSASAPFCEGRDTGLHSWRHSLLGRYPRMGVPEAWASEADYWRHLRRLQAVGSLEDGHGLWEDLRLHHRYGTLEVRICDAVASLDRVWLIVALLQAEVATLQDELLAGTLAEPLPRALIEENKWRARRHGLGGKWIDWARDQPQPLAQRLADWLRRLAPAAARLGLAGRLEAAVAQALREGSAADQQRAWWAECMHWPGVIDRLVQATAQPLSPQLAPVPR